MTAKQVTKHIQNNSQLNAKWLKYKAETGDTDVFNFCEHHLQQALAKLGTHKLLAQVEQHHFKELQ